MSSKFILFKKTSGLLRYISYLQLLSIFFSNFLFKRSS